MADIAVFHSVLGMRAGVLDAAERLRGQGHRVLAVDQYEGRVFGDCAEGIAFAERIGIGELRRRAVEAVREVPDGFVGLGFSIGRSDDRWKVIRNEAGGALEYVLDAATGSGSGGAGVRRRARGSIARLSRR